MSDLKRRLLEIRGCWHVFGVKRAINGKCYPEKSEGTAASRLVAAAEDTVRCSQRVCTRPYEHDGEHRGPRMNLMTPSGETWKRAKEAAGIVARNDEDVRSALGVGQ